jgi:hypothetical protein
VLATGPKGGGFKPGGGDGFLREINVRIAPSFGTEVKPFLHVVSILTFKDPCVIYLKCYVLKIQGHFSPTPCFTARCSEQAESTDG